jgi:hypothetical protein
MKWIKLFEDFNQTGDETLYIFDFDDTLVETPDFEELAIQYLSESNTIESLVEDSLRWIGKSKTDLRVEHGRIYVDDPDELIIPKGNWVRKGKRVYLISPNKFYTSDLSIPTSLKELSNLYKEVKNKAIVTGRTIELENKIKKVLSDFGLEKPNWGLFCYPYPRFERIAEWKAETIVNLLKETGFKKANFYDDRHKWVKKVVDAVKKQLPEVDFKGIKVS